MTRFSPSFKNAVPHRTSGHPNDRVELERTDGTGGLERLPLYDLLQSRPAGSGVRGRSAVEELGPAAVSCRSASSNITETLLDLVTLKTVWCPPAVSVRFTNPACPYGSRPIMRTVYAGPTLRGTNPAIVADTFDGITLTPLGRDRWNSRPNTAITGHENRSDPPLMTVRRWWKPYPRWDDDNHNRADHSTPAV